MQDAPNWLVLLEQLHIHQLQLDKYAHVHRELDSGHQDFPARHFFLELRHFLQVHNVTRHTKHRDMTTELDRYLEVLHIAVNCQQKFVSSMILSYCAALGERQETEAEKNRLDLLDYRQPFARDKDGNSPLEFAAKLGVKPLFFHLLEYVHFLFGSCACLQCVGVCFA